MNAYYKDEWATIYLGDSREILPGLGRFDLIFTDPPYGHNNNDGDLIHNREAALGLVSKGVPRGEARPIKNDGPEETAALVEWFFPEARRHLEPGSCLCCCCCGGGGPDPQFARWSIALDEAIGFKMAVVWDKGGLGMGWHYRRNYEFVLVAQKPGAACTWNGGNATPNVLRLTGIKPGKTDHPTPKPVALPSHFIRLHSDPGDTVLDPFMGGGSTIVAAKAMNRKAVGIELDERWAELAANRLSQEVFDFSEPDGESEEGEIVESDLAFD